MKLYKCTTSGDEMFSDTYKMRLIDGVVFEVYGKNVTRSDGDIKLDGANPSAEEAEEGVDPNAVTGVDIVLNHRLVETHFADKKQYMTYLKSYMKTISERIDKTEPDQAEQLKKNLNNYVKAVLGRFKELQFFTGENMDCDGIIALCEYREEGDTQTPVFMFFKHGLDEEKL